MWEDSMGWLIGLELPIVRRIMRTHYHLASAQCGSRFESLVGICILYSVFSKYNALITETVIPTKAAKLQELST